MKNVSPPPSDRIQHVLVGRDYERVRNSHLLVAKQIIASGSFSVLFSGETPESIYRLSTDNATHNFASRAKHRGLAGVVGLLDDYGAVAIYNQDQCFPDYLWLAHLERLAPLPEDSLQRLSIAKLLSHLTGEADGLLLTEIDEREAVIAALPTAPIDEHTKLVVDAMVSLLPDYLHEVDFDLSISNFMIRPSNGDVVLSDPVHGLSDVSADWHLYLEGEPVIFEKR
ncbi:MULTISPECIES: hypothetical protein [Pseudomonas]|uniref:Uncharacterized protein n=1 Tax=Pseudomonas fluorescens TaxID=294 RepID=A0AAE2U3E6_PSEFL|nr:MULTISPECIES: hypothetical protein [Pseudomonas]MBD8269319.1 hypothetical protein [Pseudomonas fluorescens]